MDSVAIAHGLIPCLVVGIRTQWLVFTARVKVLVQGCPCALALGMLVPGE